MKKLKILAVDDSPTMRRIIVNSLLSIGYENISEAASGEEALDIIENEDINFVVTDWNMPQMDGLSLVNEIRSSEKHKEIPILMITIHSLKEDIVEALKAGVNNYIVKPFTPDILNDKINTILATEE